jgi:hypothetical protein
MQLAAHAPLRPVSPFDIVLADLTIRLIHKLEITPELGEEAEINYRRFLTLKIRYPLEKLVATQLVDEMWHMHILHTERYIIDCERICGHYIHHTPSDDDHTAAFERTCALFNDEFGVNLKEVGALRPFRGGFLNDPGNSA